LWRTALERLARDPDTSREGMSVVQLPEDAAVGKAHAGLRDFMKKHGKEAEFAALRAAWDADRLYVGEDGGRLWYVLEHEGA